MLIILFSEEVYYMMGMGCLIFQSSGQNGTYLAYIGIVEKQGCLLLSCFIIMAGYAILDHVLKIIIRTKHENTYYHISLFFG